MSTAASLPLQANSLWSLKQYVSSYSKKHSRFDLDAFLVDHHIELREYPGPGFIVSHPHKPGYKILFINKHSSYIENLEWISKGIVHCLIHKGDQTRLPLQVSKEQEKRAEIGAKFILEYLT